MPSTIPGRLKKIVNVKDYGVVGDGVTDERKALGKAWAAAKAGGVVYLPAGKYFLGETLDLRNFPKPKKKQRKKR